VIKSNCFNPYLIFYQTIGVLHASKQTSSEEESKEVTVDSLLDEAPAIREKRLYISILVDLIDFLIFREQLKDKMARVEMAIKKLKSI